MDLKTTYMGLELKNPIIVSSSKLTSTIDNIRKCADQGAGAIVLKSLFEEQLLADVQESADRSWAMAPEMNWDSKSLDEVSPLTFKLWE